MGSYAKLSSRELHVGDVKDVKEVDLYQSLKLKRFAEVWNSDVTVQPYAFAGLQLDSLELVQCDPMLAFHWWRFP